MVSFTSSKATLALCPFSHYADKPEVTLVVSATDPDGDSLTYEYSTTGGTISAKARPRSGILVTCFEDLTAFESKSKTEEVAKMMLT